MTHAPMTHDDVLPDLMRALELFGIERLPDSSYVALTAPPGWFLPFLAASAGRPFSLVDTFPFLDGFLRDATAMWQDRTSTRLASSPFIATTGGEDLLLRAIALTIGARSIVVLERLHGAADTRGVLQRAREQALEGERLGRQAEAVRTALTQAARLARNLVDMELPDAQRDVAQRVHAAIAAAIDIAGQPPPPRGPRA